MNILNRSLSLWEVFMIASMLRDPKPKGDGAADIPNRNYLFWGAVPAAVVFLAPGLLVAAVLGTAGLFGLTVYALFQFKDWDKDPYW